MQNHILMQRIILTIIILFILLSLNLQAQEKKQPQWPEITQQNKPWARWWWEGSAVNPPNLTWMMEEYKKAGLGGLEITTIYGVKGHEEEFIDFLSPKWVRMLQHCLKEGERLDLGIDMAQASGWPFGGPWITKEHASKYVAHKTFTLKGGEQLKEAVAFDQEPLVRTVGEKIDISKLIEPIAKNQDLQLHAFDQVRFPKPLPLQTLMAYSSGGEILDLTSKVDVSGKLDWTAPKGDWKLIAVFQGWHGKMVERAAPGGEGYAIDHFSHEATTAFLHKYDDVFKGQDLKHLRAFFNDSYEVDDAQGEGNWTPRLFEEFQKRRGYDLKKYLPALFGEDAQEKNERVLTDYRETISDLLLENYTQTWHKWAEKYGKKIRNQAHGSPANILDLYAATDIPEIEGEEILRIKFASSAANVTGKALISSESATWENEHFLSKLGDVKTDLDRFILGGVNHTFYHGAIYTPKDAQWPGWLFYAATHFTPNNPFWDDFSKLNQYVARVQSFMQKGKPTNDILLYLPIYDSYAKPGKVLLQHFDGVDHGFKGTSLDETATFLEGKGFSFDYISDKQLEATSVSNHMIRTGGIVYKTVVVPEVKYMPLSTLKKLTALADAGIKVIFYKNLPSEVPGLNDLQDRRSEMKRILSGLAFTDSEDGRKATIGAGGILITSRLETALKSVNVKRESIHENGIKVIKRKHEKGYYYFLVNWSDEVINGWVPIEVDAPSVVVFNPMTGKTGFADLRKTGDRTEVFLQLEKGESVILETSTDPLQGPLYPYIVLQKSQEIKGNWMINFVKGGPTIPAAISTPKLDSWTTMGDEDLKNFSGTASYTISFKKPKDIGDAWMLDLGEVSESASVFLNGKFIGTTIGPVYKIEIPAAMLSKDNKLEVRVSNSMANRIAYMDKNRLPWKIFYNINMPARLAENRGKDGLFTAENWKPRPSGLIGPVTLTPIVFKKTEGKLNKM
jgi:hypothetical protein